MQTKQSAVILNPKSLTKILSVIAFFLVLANLITIFVKYITGDRIFYGLIPLFQLNAEYNIPTFFSGLLFLFSAVLLVFIWKARRINAESQIIWAFLAGLFLFLAFDELFKVHGLLFELIRKIFKTLGLPRFIWIIFYSTGLVLLSFLVFPVWQRLSKTVKLWFALSAFTFLGGAIGFDMIEKVYYRSIGWREDLIYGALYTIEESLEMAGLIMFIYSLLLLIQVEFKGIAFVIPDKKS